MANDLLHRFNIGIKECQDGVLLLYSDVDQKVYLRCRELTVQPLFIQ